MLCLGLSLLRAFLHDCVTLVLGAVDPRLVTARQARVCMYLGPKFGR